MSLLPHLRNKSTLIESDPSQSMYQRPASHSGNGLISIVGVQMAAFPYQYDFLSASSSHGGQQQFPIIGDRSMDSINDTIQSQLTYLEQPVLRQEIQEEQLYSDAELPYIQQRLDNWSDISPEQYFSEALQSHVIPNPSHGHALQYTIENPHHTDLPIDHLQTVFFDSDKLCQMEVPHLPTRNIQGNQLIHINSYSQDPEKKQDHLILSNRAAKVQNYLRKKAKRIWTKKISYKCRKQVAQTRPRIKGRFISKCMAAKLSPGSATAEKAQSELSPLSQSHQESVRMESNEPPIMEFPQLE